MFKRFYRQRRRILFGVFFALLGNLIEARDLFATESALMLATTLIVTILVLVLLACGLLVIFPRQRNLIELVGLSVFLMEMFRLIPLPMLDNAGVWGSLLPFFVILTLLEWTLYGRLSQRIRVPLQMRTRHRFFTALSPEALLRTFIALRSSPETYWNGQLARVVSDPEDPDTFEVAYKFGNGMHLEQEQTVLEEGPDRLRYYYVADVSAKNRDLNDGTYGVELVERPDGGTDVTVTHDMTGVRLGQALSVWFDDAIRDECDAFVARERKRRDWSMAGLFLRDLERLA